MEQMYLLAEQAEISGASSSLLPLAFIGRL